MEEILHKGSVLRGAALYGSRQGCTYTPGIRKETVNEPTAQESVVMRPELDSLIP